MNIFERLKLHNIISISNRANRSIIEKLSIDEIIEISSHLINDATLSFENSEYTSDTHISSLSFGGGREDCPCYDCRLRRLNDLLKVSTLFCNKVYMHNYFYIYSNFNASAVSDNPAVLNRIRNMFYDDIALLLKARPLLKSGILQIISPTSNFCPHCHSYHSSDTKTNSFLNTAYKNLDNIFFDIAKIALRIEDDNVLLQFYCKELFEDFGGTLELPDVPNTIKNKPMLYNRLMKNKILAISKTMAKKLEISRWIPHTLTQNVALPLYATEALQSRFLTDMSAHIDYLNLLSNETNLVRNNEIAGKHLSTIIPFFNELDINTMLKIRKREEESFIIFRNSINQATQEYRNSQNNFNETVAKEIYNDLIMPSLTMLDLKQKQARKDLLRRITTTTCAVGAISSLAFGIYNGLCQPELIKHAELFGLTSITSKIVADLITNIKGDNELRNESMYFLWKSRKKK